MHRLPRLYPRKHTTSCNCGWHAHGAEEDLIDAFTRHVEQGHGARISREQAAAKVVEAKE